MAGGTATVTNRGLECKRAIGGNYQTLGSVILQRHRSARRQAADRAADGERTATTTTINSATAAHNRVATARENNQTH